MSEVLPAATHRVDSLAQRMFPDRPHHLSVSPTRRFPVPPDFFHQYSQLQYMTFLSDTDRGILLTRPYYDIRDEPAEQQPVPAPKSAGSRAEAKKTMNKMSFKDYQQSRAKKLASPMPDSHNTLKPESRQASTADGAKPTQPSSRASENKTRPEEVASARETAHQDPNRRPRMPPRTARSPSPNPSRRSPDGADYERPQKRPRVDSITRAEPSRTPKTDPVSVKRASAPATQRDVKTAAAAAQGRSALGSQQRDSSPQRSRINGSKDKGAGAGTSRTAKTESSSRNAVPPLLSPLRLSIDEENGASGRPSIAAKRAPESSSQSKPVNKTPTKQRKWALPPLLSPTLPPVVEQELARTRDARDLDAPSSARKTIKVGIEPDEAEDEAASAALIVHLKYKKKNALRVSRLLALEPASKKEALKKERSISAEVNSPPSKKRPRALEPPADPVAAKRPRASLDSMLASKAPAPSTPLKQAAAMSRAASNNSLAQTPSGTNGYTPSAADRPPTSHEGGDQAKSGSASSLRRKYGEWTSLGTQLKHKRDGIIRSQGGAQNGNSSDALSSLSSSNRKQVAILSVEMVLSYMVAFDATNQARSLDRKAGDFSIWESLLPHLLELKTFTSQYRPLDVLRMQLHALILDSLLSVYLQHDHLLAGSKSNRIRNCHKDIGLLWTKAHDTMSLVHDAGLRADLGPWSRPQAAAAASLRVLRRFAEREAVNWRAELSLGLANGA